MVEESKAEIGESEFLEGCSIFHQICSSESLFCEICEIYYCSVCAQKHNHSQFPIRSPYRHLTDSKISVQPFYIPGAIVDVRATPKEIEVEFGIDSEMVPQIGKAKKLIGKRGRILKRSIWGWLLCDFRGGEQLYFTPYCLKVIKLYGFVNIEHAADPTLADERRLMFNRSSKNKGVLKCMERYKLCVLALVEIPEHKGMWGQNLHSGHIIRIRLWDGEWLREYWDVVLSIIHELAHCHPKIEGYGGKTGHGKQWKRLYRDLLTIFLDSQHNFSEEEIKMFLDEFQIDINNYKNGRIIKRLS